LHLEVPVGLTDAELEVTVTVQSVTPQLLQIVLKAKAILVGEFTTG
jgi:hypothetical protein